MALNLHRRALGLAGIVADGFAETHLILNLDLKAKEKPLFLLAKLSQSNAVFRLREETVSEHTQSLFWVLGIDFIWSHGLYKRRAETSHKLLLRQRRRPRGNRGPLHTKTSPSHHAVHKAERPGIYHFSSYSPQKRIRSIFRNYILSCPHHQLELAFEVLFLVKTAVFWAHQSSYIFIILSLLLKWLLSKQIYKNQHLLIKKLLPRKTLTSSRLLSSILL